MESPDPSLLELERLDPGTLARYGLGGGADGSDDSA